MPGKAKPELLLDPAWSPPRALRHVVRFCLAQMRAHVPGVLEADESRPVHRSRVALRRMRSALRLMRRAERAPPGLKSELRWLADALGEARNWDVLTDDTLPAILRAGGASPSLARLARAAQRRRATAHAEARDALSSPRYRALVAALERWLRDPLAPPERPVALRDFAAKRIGKRHKRLLRAARDLAGQNEEERHQLRIDAKRLRYAAEFFSSLYPRPAARRYIRSLVAMQDALGAINDAATAARLLEPLRPTAAFARWLRGWRVERERRGIALAARAAAGLERRKRFWE